MEQIIAQVVGGAIGGTAGGKAVSGASMGGIGNLLAGGVGGLAGGQALSGLMGLGDAAAGGGLDIASLAANAAGGGVSGLVVQMVVGFVLNKIRG